MATINIAPGTSSGPAQTSTLNALVPPEGPKEVAVPIDFSLFDTAEIDFTLAMAQAKITAVQAIYLDNSLNPGTVVITVSGTAQTITAPALSQGSYPVISTNRPKFTITSDGGVAVTVIFMNVPLTSNVWFPADGPLVGVTSNPPLAFTITTGTTPVTVWNTQTAGGNNNPLAAGRVVNPFAATESLFVDIVNNAADSAPGPNGTTIELVPGQAFDVPADFSGVISANAVTTGHTFSAYFVY